MSFRFLSLFLVFFISKTLWSQSYTFDGVLRDHDEKVIPYSIIINIDSLHNISGVSKKTIHSVPSSAYLEGKFNQKNKTIYFKETSLNKDNFSIEFQGIISKILDKYYVLPGIYIDNSKKEGHINIMSYDFNPNQLKIKDNFTPIVNEEATNKFLKDELIKKTKEVDSFSYIKGGERAQIKSSSSFIYVKIYDQLDEDRDVVKLVFNEKVLGDKIKLTHEGYVYKLEVKKGKNVLYVQAIDEGAIPFNTSKIQIYNSGFHKYYTNILNRDEKAYFEIIY